MLIVEARILKAKKVTNMKKGKNQMKMNENILWEKIQCAFLNYQVRPQDFSLRQIFETKGCTYSKIN